jgi:hypothetical protein
MSKLHKVPRVRHKKIVLSPEQERQISEAASFLLSLSGVFFLQKIPEAAFEKADHHAANLTKIVPGASRGELLQMHVAIGYAIRKELLGPGNWKQARGETATAHNVTDNTVSVYYTRWRKVAHKSVERQVAEYDAARRAPLLRELLGHLTAQA